MYKGASRNAQGRADRILMKDMPAGTTLSLKDEYENGKKALNHLDRLLSGNLTPEQRTAIGHQKLAMATRQCEIKKQLGKHRPIKKRDPNEFATHLIEAMKATLGDVETGKIVSKASQSYDAQNKREVQS